MKEKRYIHHTLKIERIEFPGAVYHITSRGDYLGIHYSTVSNISYFIKVAWILQELIQLVLWSFVMYLSQLRDDLEQQFVYEDTQFVAKLCDCLSACLFHNLSSTELPLPYVLIFVEAYSHCYFYNFFIYRWWNRFIMSLQAFNINFYCLLNIF